jgi:hypothetical protein
MTQREIVRTAIMLGGIWLILSGFASLPSIVADFAGSTRHSDRDATEEIRDLFLIYLPSGLLGVLLAAIPGIYAISSADRWAARLVPDDETDLEIRPSLILAVGAMLMGLSTGISGAISFAASGAGLIIQLIDEEASRVLVEMMVERALYGAFAVLAGILIFRWGSRAVLRAA